MNLPSPAECVRQSVTWADLEAIPIPLPVDSWWAFGVVLVLLMLFIWVVVRLVSRTTDDTDPAEVDRQMLTAINELHRQGDLSQEEFRSIKGQLVERLAERPNSGSANSVSGPVADAADKSPDHKQPNKDSPGVGAMPTEQQLPNADHVQERQHDSSA